MGFWFNNYLAFERKRKEPNKLILNFYYYGDRNEQNKSVKIIVNQNIKIATDPLEFFEANKVFRKLNFGAKVKSIFKEKEILELSTPYSKPLIDKLPKEFYRGDYEKRLKFDGFYPERKVKLSSKLEKLFLEKDVIEMENLDEIDFGEFLSLEEWQKLPYVVLDIEKPLWKKEHEKRNLNLREKILKKYKNLNSKKKKQAKRIIKELEKRLTVDINNLGEIKLYDELFEADISYIGTIWGNGTELKKELYVIDYNDEITHENYNEFNIIKFNNEKDLIEGLKKSFKKRKPIISYGHNQVYDFTQLRFAAENNKIIYDPAVHGIQPKRDFVRNFLQRLKEDLVYLDTMYLSKSFYSFLGQKNFGSSFKLGGISKFFNIDFTKSLSHEELRHVEAKRLIGKTKKQRKEAINEMLFYTSEDLNTTKEVASKLNPLPLLIGLKKIMPYCTLTEIAFSTNCMNKIHQHRHFENTINLPYTGYNAKKRIDESQEFITNFPKIKKKILEWAGLKKIKGNHKNVSQYYLPLEEWLKDFSFGLEPGLKQVYEDAENKFIFSQYHKAFFKEIFIDYYLARTKKIYPETFEKKYNFSINNLRKGIASGYTNLANEIKEKGLEYFGSHPSGDYIFVKGNKELKLAYKIRQIKNFSNSKKVKKNPLQLELF